MTQVIIASQLDEDYNDVIRARLTAIHPGAQVIGVPAGVPSSDKVSPMPSRSPAGVKRSVKA